jgi:hypothetical protein
MESENVYMTIAAVLFVILIIYLLMVGRKVVFKESSVFMPSTWSVRQGKDANTMKFDAIDATIEDSVICTVDATSSRIVDRSGTVFKPGIYKVPCNTCTSYASSHIGECHGYSYKVTRDDDVDRMCTPSLNHTPGTCPFKSEQTTLKDVIESMSSIFA